MSKIKENQLLYRGCACEDLARIVRVGKDVNGLDVVDIELLNANDINELYFPRAQTFEVDNSLARIELPKGTKVVIRDVPYRVDSDSETLGITLAVSTGGCYRCTEHFYPHDEGKRPFEK